MVPNRHWIAAGSFLFSLQSPCWCVDRIIDAPLFGAQVNNLQIVSASAAFLHGDPDGWFAQISPGLAGGKVSVGYGMGGLPGICGFIATDTTCLPLLGFEIKASYLKTWWPELNRIPSESLVGMELDGIFLINVTVGVFQAIDRAHGSRGTRLSIGGGIGF